MRHRFVSLLVLLVIAGCTPRYKKNWNQLRPGMDRLDVLELLGEPGLRVKSGRSSATQPGDLVLYLLFWREAYKREVWTYGPGGLLGSLDNMFGASRNANVVVFDQQRHLERWRGPLAPGQPDPLHDDVSDTELLGDMARIMVADDASAHFVAFDDPARRTIAQRQPGVCAPPSDLRAHVDTAGRCYLSWRSPPDMPGDARHPRFLVVLLPDVVRGLNAIRGAATLPSANDLSKALLLATDRPEITLRTGGVKFGAFAVWVVSDDGQSKVPEPAPIVGP